MEEQINSTAPANVKKGGGLKKWLFIGCGSAILIMVLLFGGCLVWVITLPEGGVRLGNQMEPYALKYLEDNKILPENSSIVAYYDSTVNCTGEEAAILTKKQVIYHKEGNNNTINLKDIKDIKFRKEPLVGDVIEIYSKDGNIMKIEIAPFNQAGTFINALKNSWETAKGASESVSRLCPPK